jgi:hypothetical protein
MAKKQKRSVSRSAAPVVRETVPFEVSAEKPAPSNGSRYQVSTNRTQVAQDFNPDYSHVKADLKRIGVLAGSFITILVVLSFFLR